MKIFGKKTCKKCNSKGFITMTASNVHNQKHEVPCSCLLKVARMTIPQSQIEKYEAKIEEVNGVRTMFLIEKPIEGAVVEPIVAAGIAEEINVATIPVIEDVIEDVEIPLEETLDNEISNIGDPIDTETDSESEEQEESNDEESEKW